MEDESRQISAPGRTDLYEAGSIDDNQIPNICSFNDGGGAPCTIHRDRHTAMITDVVLPMIGIILIALILVVWL